MHRSMLNKYYEPTYAIVTMVAMRTFWLLEENGCYGRQNFEKLILSKLFVFFLVRALILKDQSNKKCVSIKISIKIHFPLLYQPRFYLRMK